MKILFLGDIVGKSGRNFLLEKLPIIIDSNEIDFVIVNGENAAHGFGITKKIVDQLIECGVDAITLGNHTWDKQEIIKWLDDEKQVVRPINYPEDSPGEGLRIIKSKRDHKVMVSNVLGRVFMSPNYENPFLTLNKKIPKGNPVSNGLDAVIIDVHAEATAEKQGLGYYFDGRATLVVGTHTHVPTEDARILEKGTAYKTDAGMCGSYDSIIGMDKDIALSRMFGNVPFKRHTPAVGDVTLFGVIVVTDVLTGLAKEIKNFRFGKEI